MVPDLEQLLRVQQMKKTVVERVQYNEEVLSPNNF